MSVFVMIKKHYKIISKIDFVISFQYFEFD